MENVVFIYCSYFWQEYFMAPTKLLASKKQPADAYLKTSSLFT